MFLTDKATRCLSLRVASWALIDSSIVITWTYSDTLATLVSGRLGGNTLPGSQ
jgi:hypothetical protein